MYQVSAAATHWQGLNQSEFVGGDDYFDATPVFSVSEFSISAHERAYVVGAQILDWNDFSVAPYNDDGRAYYISTELLDAEKLGLNGTYGNLLCWAATCANILVWTNWAWPDDNLTEDSVFDVFCESFTDQASNPAYGLDWYIYGNYWPDGKSGWAQPNKKGAFYADQLAAGENYISYHTIDASADLYSLMATGLSDGAGIGILLGWYKNGIRNGGHAVSLWGYTVDDNYDPTDRRYVTGLWVTDSDDDLSSNPLGANDTLKLLSISWDASMGMYHFTDYANERGYLNELIVLESNPYYSDNAIRDGDINLEVSGSTVETLIAGSRLGGCSGDIRLSLTDSTISLLLGGCDGGDVTGDIAITVSGGSCGELCGGGTRNIYGLFGDVNNVTIIVNGGMVSTIYGVGECAAKGDVSVSVGGGETADFTGGGIAASNGGAIAGDYTLTVGGGTITGAVNGNREVVTGTSSLKLATGGSQWNFAGTVTGFDSVIIEGRVYCSKSQDFSSSAVSVLLSSSDLTGLTVNRSYRAVGGNDATFLWGDIFLSIDGVSPTLLSGGYFFRDLELYRFYSDTSGLYIAVATDSENPTVPERLAATVTDDDVKFAWNQSSDNLGVAGYEFRYGTTGNLVDTGTVLLDDVGYALSDLANGTYYWQVRSVDRYGNRSSWSEVETFSVTCHLIPDTLSGGASGLSWTTPDFDGSCRVELSSSGNSGILELDTTARAVDIYNLSAGNYSFRVLDEGEQYYSEIATFDVPYVMQAAVAAVSDGDGLPDAFFTRTGTVWTVGYLARNMGSPGGSGTGEYVELNGKNRICDVYSGSADANILFLTDGGNGDALELDDLFSYRPTNMAALTPRLNNISEIRAGGGDDVVDLTSRRFRCENVILRGGDGDDVLWSGGGDNQLFGDGGSDRLTGGDGDDVLCGGEGDDTLHGGGGNDIFTFGGNWGHDTVTQFDSGGVTLWFDQPLELAIEYDGSGTKISCGENTIEVLNRKVTLADCRFGGTTEPERYAALAASGAFVSVTTDKIFSGIDYGIVAVL